MGLLNWLFGSEETRLGRRAAAIEKELAALEPQLEAERQRLVKAAQSPRDADLANLLIARINEDIGRAPQGSSGLSTLRRADKLKEELAEIRRQLAELDRQRTTAPSGTKR